MLALKAFLQFVRSEHLFTPEDRVLLAVSGGKDSVLMAHLFAKAGFQFAIAHCNFKLRGSESKRDENFVRLLAESLHVPFFVRQFDTSAYAEAHKISIQMAARDLRYTWFEELAQSNAFNFVALAQHQNDAVETILYNLTRGTGIAGLHGIQAKRDIWIRPLLCFTAAEIAQIVKQEKLDYVEDSSNAKLLYSRNLIRHQVVPHLKEINPHLEKTFQENSRRFADMELLLEQRVEELKPHFLKRDLNDRLYFERAFALNLVPRTLLLYHLLKDYGLEGPQIENLMHVLESGDSGKRVESSSFVLWMDRDKVYIKEKSVSTSANPGDDKEMAKQILSLGENFFDKGTLVISENHNVKMEQSAFHSNQIQVDANSLKWPLYMRYFQIGDRFKPLGMKGSKKLSDFFISLKIPQPDKAFIPLLCDAEGRIVWVIPYRMGNDYKITSSTKKVVIFEWKLEHGK